MNLDFKTKRQRKAALIKFFFLLFLSLINISAFCGEKKKMFNPITDVNWDLLFPMHISGTKIGKGSDFVKYKKKFVECPGIHPKVGFPFAFWEPTMIIEVVRTPYNFVTLGGISFGKAKSRKLGMYSEEQAFYHVHVIKFPLFNLVSKALDISPNTKAFFSDCLNNINLEVSYVSELDPTWNNERWASILSPERFLFANTASVLACVADCTATSTVGRGIEKLFWCAGCQGSLYPFTGCVDHPSSPLQASSLLVHRVLALLHRSGVGGLDRCYVGENFCSTSRKKIVPKLSYKTQLIHPVAQTKGKGNALGATTLFWESGKTFPGGEDFAYLIWRKKHCVLDLSAATLEAAKQGAGK